jgi:hypothetical protein
MPVLPVRITSPSSDLFNPRMAVPVRCRTIVLDYVNDCYHILEQKAIARCEVMQLFATWRDQPVEYIRL